MKIESDSFEKNCEGVKKLTMREIFVNQDHARVGFYQSVLEEAGIRTIMRNEFANNITDMPAALFFPTLCVLDDEDYEEAMRLLGPIYNAPTSQVADWTCPKCGESVPGNFDVCWQCNTLRLGLPNLEGG